jgi:hypothetical protein
VATRFSPGKTSLGTPISNDISISLNTTAGGACA